MKESAYHVSVKVIRRTRQFRMQGSFALINAFLLVALVAADNEWGSGVGVGVVPDRLKGIKKRDLESGSSMKSSKSSGGSSGGSKSSKSMNVPTVAAPTMMVTPTIGGSKSKSKSKSKSGGSKSSKSQSFVPQPNDCDLSNIGPDQIIVETPPTLYGVGGTVTEGEIETATCAAAGLASTIPVAQCCTVSTVTATRRLEDLEERRLQQEPTASPQPSTSPSMANPTPSPSQNPSMGGVTLPPVIPPGNSVIQSNTVLVYDQIPGVSEDEITAAAITAVDQGTQALSDTQVIILTLSPSESPSSSPNFQ